MSNKTSLTSCSNPPLSVPSDAGVAGIGVLLSFIVTAAIAITLSATLIFSEWRQRSKSSTASTSFITWDFSVVRRKLLNSYSDQQILTGIALQSIGLAKTSTMVPYHFFLIWMLSLLSMAVHNATLLALVRDFRRDWVLRWLRQFLMFVNLVLSCVYGVFILQAVRRDLNTSTLPMHCVWDSETETSGNPARDAAVSFFGTIAVIAGNVLVFAAATWYLHSRATAPRSGFYVGVQAVGLLLMTGSAIGVTARVVLMAQAFGKPPITLDDQGERVWSFGSLLSLGLLLLPLVSVIEIVRGEVRCAPPVSAGAASEDDKVTLLGSGGEEGGNEMSAGLKKRVGGGGSGGNDAGFQPNPFWGK